MIFGFGKKTIPERDVKEMGLILFSRFKQIENLYDIAKSSEKKEISNNLLIVMEQMDRKHPNFVKYSPDEYIKTFREYMSFFENMANSDKQMHIAGTLYTIFIASRLFCSNEDQRMMWGVIRGICESN